MRTLRIGTARACATLPRAERGGIDDTGVSAVPRSGCRLEQHRLRCQRTCFLTQGGLTDRQVVFRLSVYETPENRLYLIRVGRSASGPSRRTLSLS